jgi:hypothetical protein
MDNEKDFISEPETETSAEITAATGIIHGEEYEIMTVEVENSDKPFVVCIPITETYRETGEKQTVKTFYFYPAAMDLVTFVDKINTLRGGNISQIDKNNADMLTALRDFFNTSFGDPTAAVFIMQKSDATLNFPKKIFNAICKGYDVFIGKADEARKEELRINRIVREKNANQELKNFTSEK